MIKISITFVLLFFGFTAPAQTPEQTGLEIIVEADRRNTGFGDSRADMEMVLKNKHGDISRRQLRVRTLEIDGDGDKSLIIFDNPRDVNGTALLSFAHALKADDQWLYLPALKRVKRISSSNKSGPFMGSEFAYEDLTSQEVEKYRYKYLRDEIVDGQNCFVVEFYPQYEHSGYTREIVWVDQDRYRPLRVEYYDRKNALLKTQSLKDYHQYLDRYWRAHEMLMINHQTGKSTQLGWRNYQFKNGFSERDFDRNSLKRAR